MTKNKYEFIRELLFAKNLPKPISDRVLSLAAKEISSYDILEKRIANIEGEIYDSRRFPPKNDTIIEGPPATKKTENLPKYIDPRGAYNFLFTFNQDPILKSTCHEIDSDGIERINDYCGTEMYDFQSHLSQIVKAYDKLDRMYAPSQIKSLIRVYLTGKKFDGTKEEKGWSTDRIRWHWSHPDLLKWTAEYPNTPPNLMNKLFIEKRSRGFVIEGFTSKITGNRIQNFTELVLLFKNMFHIRNDNPLRDLIELKNKDEGFSDLIDFTISDTEFQRNVELFVHVDLLLQAYKKIISLIIEQQEKSNPNQKPKVKLCFKEESEQCITFSIHHLNSVYSKSLQSTLDRPIGQSYESLIVKQINGLCHLDLIADFGKGEFASINLWDGKKTNKIVRKEFSGVEHVLKFIKK